MRTSPCTPQSCDGPRGSVSMRPLGLAGQRSLQARRALVSLVSIAEWPVDNRCVSAPHDDDMRRRRRESHGWRGLARSGRVVGPGEGWRSLFLLYFTAISRLSRGYLAVISRLSHGYLTVISRLFHGYLSFISRLSFGYPAAIPFIGTRNARCHDVRTRTPRSSRLWRSGTPATDKAHYSRGDVSRGATPATDTEVRKASARGEREARETQRRSGAAAQRRSGAAAQRRSGAVAAQRRSGAATRKR